MKRTKSYKLGQVMLWFAGWGILIFGSGIHNELVLDDNAQLTENVLVHDLKYVPNLFFGSTFYAGNNLSLQGLYYRPVMLLIFALIYHFWGSAVVPYHLVQLALHIANATMLFYLFKKWLPVTVSLWGATLFLIHPINAEAVIYISNLQDVLLAFFGLLALLIVIEKPSRFTKLKKWWLTLLCLELSLMSKEVGALWVVIIWGYVWGWNRREFKRYFWGGLLVMGSYAALRLRAIGWPSSDRIIPIAAASIHDRLLTIPRIWWYYLSLFGFPNKMAIAQNWVVRKYTLAQVGWPLVKVLGFLGGLGTIMYLITKKQLKTQRWLVWLGGWFLLGLLIHSQIFPLDVTVADRWFYTPGMALCGILALGVAKYEHKKTTWIVLGIILVGLGVRTYLRVNDWRTAFNLYSHDYAIVGSSFTLDNNLGLEYLKQGNLNQALVYLKRSVQAVPKWGISWNNLGIAYELKGDFPRAEAAYLQAIKYPSGYSPMVNLSRIRVEKLPGEVNQTTSLLNNALTLYPENPDLWYLMSEWSVKQRDYPHAVMAAQRFAQIFPGPASQQWLTKIASMSPEIPR